MHRIGFCQSWESFIPCRLGLASSTPKAQHDTTAICLPRWYRTNAVVWHNPEPDDGIRCMADILRGSTMYIVYTVTNPSKVTSFVARPNLNRSGR